MGSIITICIIFGIPAIFLFLCIKNIVGIIKSKKNKDNEKKSFIIKSIVFGVIFTLIIVFYICVLFLLSRAIANNM